MLIYKIFRADELATFMAAGETEGSPIDIADGYIHFSTAIQVPKTTVLHFAHEKGLTLVAVETESLGDDLKWETSRGGTLFPHLYRPLRMDDVAWIRSLPLVGERHLFPAEMV